MGAGVSVCVSPFVYDLTDRNSICPQRRGLKEHSRDGGNQAARAVLGSAPCVAEPVCDLAGLFGRVAHLHQCPASPGAGDTTRVTHSLTEAAARLGTQSVEAV